MNLKTCITLCTLCAATAWGLLGFGCGLQGEGERCDLLNNNDDGQDGLVCTSKTTVNLLSDVCCPPPPNPATVVTQPSSPARRK